MEFGGRFIVVAWGDGFFGRVVVFSGQGFGTAGFACEGTAFAGAVFLCEEALLLGSIGIWIMAEEDGKEEGHWTKGIRGYLCFEFSTSGTFVGSYVPMRIIAPNG